MTKQLIKQKQLLIVKPFHNNEVPRDSWIWVFGSDEAGRHTCGAAKIAHACFGYSYGICRGAFRKAYGIPVFDKKMNSLHIDAIRSGVNEFIEYAKKNETKSFHISRVSVSGLDEAEIASMFNTCPTNCSLPKEWSTFLNR